MWGWIGNLLILIGVWNLGNRKRIAFLFAIAGESLWAANAWAAGWYDLMFISMIAVLMAGRNWIKWGKIELPQSPYNTNVDTIVGCARKRDVPVCSTYDDPASKARALQDCPQPVAVTTDTL